MERLTEKIWQWIEEHQNSDTTKLRLKMRKSHATEMDFAILQIECRQKVAKKLPQTLANNHFLFPTTLSTEQCTSEALAQFHSSLINDGETILDMSAGLGIDSFHFANRAKLVTAIEIDHDIAEVLDYNSTVLGITNMTVINSDSSEYIKATNNHYDTIFIDPARRRNDGKRLYALSACTPNVIEILGVIKQKCDKLIIKASPMLDASQIIRDLDGITDLYAIGTPHECKELVAVLNFKKTVKTPMLHCVTLDTNGQNIFSFTIKEEREALAHYSMPKEGDFIYEPYPTIMKMQPVKLLSMRYGLDKLHINTHLYVSTTYNGNFPGDCFKIDKIYRFSSRSLAEIAKCYPRLNVAVRNFAITADELRSRLKLKDSDTYRLLGTTVADGSLQLIISSRTNEP